MKNLLQNLLLALMLICGGAFVQPVLAQSTAVEAESSESADELDYKQVSAELAQMEEDIKTNRFTRQSLEDDLNILSGKEMAIDAFIRNIEKQSKYAQDALAAFGDAPAEGETEDDQIAEMREKYTASVAGYKNKIIEANLLKTEIARLNAMIADARSQVLLGNLVAERDMLISPKNFFKAVNDAVVFLWQVTL